MKNIPSLLRIAEHEALKTLSLSGNVLDLGGEKDAEYLSHITGTFSVTAVNTDAHAKPDVVHDLEELLPFPDASYDHVLLVNVLEHIFNYRQLLAEAVRVVRPGGQIIVVVPFLFPVHPSPQDFWRFTSMALKREGERLKLVDMQIVALGSGVFSSQYVMFDRILPVPLRILSYYSVRVLVPVLDTLFTRLAQILGKKYLPSDYALGYRMIGRKSTKLP